MTALDSNTRLYAHGSNGNRKGRASFQTIESKIPGAKCRRCLEPIAVGSVIRWLPGRGSWHLSTDPACSAGADQALVDSYADELGITAEEAEAGVF